MSMFSLPDELMRDVKKFEAMTEEMTAAMLPAGLASAANLLAHPLAGMAAASAVGVGLASHGLGLWLGAVSALAEAQQRLFAPLHDGFGVGAGSSRAKRSPASKAKSTARVLIEDAQSTALEIAAAADAAGSPALAEAAVPAGAGSAGMQPEDFRQPKSMPKPRKPDDLKAISGIGPKLETVLNGLGVWTYAQIAAWTEEEIAWVDDYLSFRGRIGRDDWIGQAARLAAKKTKR